MFKELIEAMLRDAVRLPAKSRKRLEAAFVMSDQMKADAIQRTLDDDKDPDLDGDDDTSWDSYERGRVRHVFPDNTVVFQMGWDGDWFKRSFTIDENGEATLGGDCVQVMPQLTFAPCADGDAHTESMASQALAALDNRDSAVPFDKAYLAKAVDHHETAIHLATKATTDATDPAVKTLAKKIVKDHTPHLNELKALHGVVVTGKDSSAGASEARRESAAPGRTTFREVMDATAITETVDGEDGFHISGTAIDPGINRSGNRIYAKETLKAALPLFIKKKMYIDHPDAIDEREGVRSFRDAGAVIQEAWVNTRGGIDYKAVVIDPPLREKLALMKKAGALDAMGTSINYYGTSSKEAFEGRMVDKIESIDELNSLDFVTEPGAWGTIAHMESRAAGAVAQKGTTPMDEATKKLLEEMKAALDAQTQEAKDARKEAADARAESRVAVAKSEIRTLLAESKLPEITQARLLKHFEGVETTEGVAETITAEREYIEKLTEGMTAKPKPKAAPARRTNIVVGLGETGTTSGTESVEDADEDRPAPTAEKFAEAFDSFMPGGKVGAEAFAKMMG